MSPPNDPPSPPEPIPAPPSAPATPPPGRAPTGGLDSYHIVADTIGGVPNLRLKDNLFQTLFVAGFTLVGAVLGLLLIAVPAWAWWMRAGVGAVAGLMVGTIISGLVLMVLGWTRSAKALASKAGGRPPPA